MSADSESPRPRYHNRLRIPIEVWVTHQEGELGVRVCGKVFTLYKGESLYHPDGQCRRVEKREFGEAIKSIQHLKSRPPCP